MAKPTVVTERVDVDTSTITETSTKRVNVATDTVTESSTERVTERPLTSDGNSLTFNGGHVLVGDVLDLTGSFTLEAIFNLDDSSLAGQRLIVKDDSVDGWGFSVGDSGNAGTLRFFHRDFDTIITDSPLGTLKDGVTYHVAAVFDASAQTVTLYVDGVQVAQSTSQASSGTDNANSLSFGATASDATKVLIGRIYETRMWDDARSSSEIASNLEQGSLVGSEANLIGLWSMADVTDTVTDSTSNGNDGTLVGEVTGQVRNSDRVTGAITETSSQRMSAATDTVTETSTKRITETPETPS